MSCRPLLHFTSFAARDTDITTQWISHPPTAARHGGARGNLQHARRHTRRFPPGPPAQARALMNTRAARSKQVKALLFQRGASQSRTSDK